MAKASMWDRFKQSVSDTVSNVKQSIKQSVSETALNIWHSKPVTMARGAVELVGGVAITLACLKGVLFFGTAALLTLIPEGISNIATMAQGKEGVLFPIFADMVGVAGMAYMGMKFGGGTIRKGMEDLGWVEPKQPENGRGGHDRVPEIEQGKGRGHEKGGRSLMAHRKEDLSITQEKTSGVTGGAKSAVNDHSHDAAASARSNQPVVDPTKSR